jgi:endonuclease G
MHKLITLLCLLALALPAYAQTSCQEQFADGKAPVITNPKMTTKYRELCNQAYAVGHSGITRTPLWAAEHLTRDHLMQGRGLKRSNNFRSDTRLPYGERAELSDYSRSGYDRGHMAPSADFADTESQDESFLLSNIIPQVPENNRGIHERIESVVRKEVKRRGDLYVVTGPLFQGQSLQSLKGRVMIPTGVYKCLYDPNKLEAGCYLEQNGPGADYSTVSVSEIEKLAGINLFPALTQDAKSRVMRLPAAKVRSRKGNQ